MGGLVNVAAVLTDLVGSTALASRVGPEAAERLRVEHFSLLCGVVGRHEGREIKNLGDGLMVAFAQPSVAVAVAVAVAVSVEMHQLLERRNRNDAGESLVIRVAVSVGEADIDDDGDLFGPPVVEVARLCAVAEDDFTVTAVDRAGNTTVSTIEYRVVYIGSELLPPLKPAPDVTRATAGGTIPLKCGSRVGVVVVVVAVAVTGGADEDSRLDELANDPLLVDTPVTAEVRQPAIVNPAREEAFGVREEFHTAGARWSVPLGLDATAAAWANSLVDDDVWQDVVAVCRVYADGERQIGLGARRSANGYTVSASIDLVPTDADTTRVCVTLVVPVDGDGEPTTDAPPDLACLE